MYNDSPQQAVTSLGSGRMLTISERLYQQKKDLNDRLSLVETAIAALEKSPEVLEAINAISRVGIY